MSETQVKSIGRLLSLDFYRGLTMFLLVTEFSHLFALFVLPQFEGSFIHTVGAQFHHAFWEGLHFWDLIQPFFMFIVGVAMPLSFSKRIAKGASYKQLSKHVFKRAFLLLLLGWGLECIYAQEIVFKFQNVLAQLAVTYLLAFLVIRKSVVIQIGFSILLILISEGLYRFFPVEGFTNAFVDGENFGAWFNILVSGEEDGSDWAMFNAIPTAAHTIWGVLAGQLLTGNNSAKKKLQILVGAGVVVLLLGYGFSSFTPIIKRISTSTFVFASGGWAIIALALCYWIIDIKKYQKGVIYFAVIGMNPLFIYLFAHVGGAAASLISEKIHLISNGLFSWAGEFAAQVILSCSVLFLLWYVCYWLYKKKIFIKI